MAKTGAHQIHETLTKLGFKPQSQRGSISWVLRHGNSSDELVLFQRHDTFRIIDLKISWSAETISQTVLSHLQQNWGRKVRLWHSVKSDGRLAFVAEFRPPPSPSKRGEHRLQPPGAIGWSVQLSASDDVVRLFLDDFFALGPVPNQWTADVAHSTLKAFAGRASRFARCKSLYEFEIAPALLVASHTGQKVKHEDLAELQSFACDQGARELTSRWEPISAQWQLFSKRNLPAGTNVHQPKISMNALESRAITALVQGFDNAVMDRKSNLPPVDGNTPAMVQRKCIQHFWSPPQKSALLWQPPSHTVGDERSPLVESTRLRIATMEERWSDAVVALSHLSEAIRCRFDEIESIHSLRTALPELAGDLYSKLNSETALVAYEHALIPSEEARILEKAAHFAKNFSAPEQELTLLHRWRSVERRQHKLSLITERIVSLELASDHPDLALTQVELLLDKDTAPTIPTVQLIEQCAQRGQAVRALDVLSRFERLSTAGGKLDTLVAEANKAVARIWVHTLKRPDLAAGSLVAVVNAPKFSSHQELEAAENDLEIAGHLPQAMQSRLQRWRAMSVSDRAQHAVLGSKLFQHVVATGRPDLQFALALELLESSTIPPGLANILPSWLSESMPWRDLAIICRPLLDRITFPNNLRPVLARLAREKIGDHSLALEFLTVGTHASEIREDDFVYVIEQLSRQNEPERAAEFTVARLDSAPPADAQSALNLAVYHQIVDRSGVLHIKICDHWATNYDPTLLLKRFSTMLAAQEDDQAQHLTQTVIERLSDKPNFYELLESILEVFAASNSNRKAALSKPILDCFVDHNGRSLQSLSKGVEYFKAQDTLDLAQHYLRELVERGHLPEVDQSAFESIFVGDYDILAKFFVLLMGRAPDNQKVNYARQALAQFKASGVQSSECLSCYATLVTYDTLSSDDLTELRTAVGIHGRHDLLIGGLIQVAKQSTSLALPAKLLDEAARIAMDELNDPVLAYEITAQAYQDSLNANERLILIHAAQLAGRVDHAIQICEDILSTPSCLSIGGALFEVLEVLANLSTTKTTAATTLQTISAWARSADNQELVAKLAEFAVTHGLATKAMITVEIMNQIDKDNFSSAVGNVLRLVYRADQQKESIAPLFDQLQTGITKRGDPSTWWQILGQINTEERLASFSPASRREIIFRYANWLYSTESRRGEALAKFAYMYQEYPNDNRSWIPLYILYEDAGQDQELIQHLERIVPKIEAKPSIIEHMPISLEGIKTSLQKARARSSQKLQNPQIALSPERLIIEKPKSSDRSDQVARVQAELLAAIPSISIKTSSFGSPMESTAAMDLTDGPEPSAFVRVDSVVTQSKNNDRMTSTWTSSDNTASTASHKPSSVAIQEAEKTLDWRVMTSTLEAPSDATERMMRTAFASEAEKHIALQVAALSSGDFESLEHWHWRVWRYPGEFGYGLSSTQRMPDGNDLAASMRTPVHKLLMMLSPALARYMRATLSIDAVIRQRLQQPKLLMNRLAPDSPAIARTGLRHFVEKLGVNGFLFIDTPEIGNDIYTDPFTRGIHFSTTSCETKPPGYLLHRARYQAFAVASGFFALTQLDARKDILPFIEQTARIARGTSIERIRSGFASDAPRLKRILQNVDLSKIKTQLSLCESLSLKDIIKVQQDLSTHNFRVQLAGTLDLIGLCEAIIGEAIIGMERQKLQATITQSKVIRDLIEFAATIKF